MRFRVKTSSTSKVVSVEGTLGALLRELEHEGLHNGDVVAIKHGFPPQKVSLDDELKSLAELGLKLGDQLILETSTGAHSKDNAVAGKQDARPAGANEGDIPHHYDAASGTYTILRNVPDDNSCLFNSIVYALLGIRDEPVESEVARLRHIVADAIGRNPSLFSELVLGKPVDQYRQWITKKDSWGGAIELGILAQHFGVDIQCLDVETAKLIKFESDNAANLVVLVYSGIHYDVMARNRVLSVLCHDKQRDQCVFAKDSDEGRSFLHDCVAVAQLLQKQSYATNTTTFRVRCLECYEVLVGEMGASNHASERGHYRFGEVESPH